MQQFKHLLHLNWSCPTTQNIKHKWTGITARSSYCTTCPELYNCQNRPTYLWMNCSLVWIVTMCIHIHQNYWTATTEFSPAFREHSGPYWPSVQLWQKYSFMLHLYIALLYNIITIHHIPYPPRPNQNQTFTSNQSSWLPSQLSIFNQIKTSADSQVEAILIMGCHTSAMTFCKLTAFGW